MITIAAALLMSVQVAPASAADSAATARGAQGPAYSADGRLALSIRGDLWIRSGTGTEARDSVRWVHVTQGAAWDRDPAWTADGSALVFASDRSGNGDLWRVRVSATGAAGDAERVTSAPEWEGEPSVARDGSIAFVRGRGATARLWLRAPDGTERRLTKSRAGAERWPAWSPSGDRLAYGVVREGRTRLRIRWVAGDSDRVVVEDRDAERPAWSPSGDRIVFATRTGRAGVWVTTPDARYVNFVSARRAEPAWSPDGRTLALAELPLADVGYNGDPDRLGDREVGDAFPGVGRLWLVPAPIPPDGGTAALALAPALARADRQTANGETFERVWARSAQLYFAAPDARRAQWDALRAKYRPRAMGVATDLELETVLHEMLRERPPLREPATGRAAVSSAHPVATSAGLEILRKGGNVVDAAVAISFALGVVEPDASGIGGYGQMLVRLRAMDRPTLIEFMARAPEEATLGNGALLRGGSYPDDGPVLVNVPGTVAAMELAWRKYGSGKVKWADLVAPAIRAAEGGFAVSEGLATTLATEREHFLKYAGSRALYFPKGEPRLAGDTLRNPDLAWTLRQIADSGGAAFYRGEVARRMVTDLRGNGNAMRPSDLARYFAAEREPVSGTYRGHTVYSSAPPSSGGATLVSQLNLLEGLGAPRPYTEDAATLHAMIEAWKLVPSGRGRIADPGLWPVRVDAFVSKDSARARWVCFNPRRSLTPDDIRGDTLPCAKKGAASTRADTRDDAGDGAGDDDVPSVPAAAPQDDRECPGHGGLPVSGVRVCHLTGTTSFAVADADGNVVSATQTLGTWGGNFYITPGLGFLYNDKLASYPTDADEYGARVPNARHGSSLAPTIVFRGEGAARRPVLAAGAAGNAWITSAVYSVVTGVIDQGLDVQRAIELPRFLIGQGRGETRREFSIQMEDGVAPSVTRQLAALGHTVQRISLLGELRMGYAAAITLGEQSVTAGADPRRSGAAGAIGCSGDRGEGCRR